MKKSYVYLTALLLFFVGIMNCFAVDIKTTTGWFPGYGISENPYSCAGVNKGVLDLKDQNNVLYYSADCSVDFPCNPSSGSSCVNTNSYSYNPTGICYITCDNYTDYSKLGENQHKIWNKIASYPHIPCDENNVTDSEQYDDAVKTLIANGCEASSTFYALKEYKYNIDESTTSKVVDVRDLGKCEPKIEVKKECIGFTTGTFKIQVGDEQATISCGETKTFEVAADTPIKVQELNSSNYLVYMDSKLSSDGTISVSEGITEKIIITNALGKATLTKTNAVNGSTMKDITFTLEKKVGTEWVPATKADGTTQFENQTTNNNGQLTFSEIPVGEYRLREVSDKNGNFIASNPVPFVINKDSVGKENNYTNFLTTTNNPFRVKIVKVDESGNSLDGAVFSIEKKNAQGKFETTSSVTIEKEGNYINFEKNGVYKIKETQAPIGYDVLQVPFEIEIKDGVVKINSGDLQYVSIAEESGVTVLKITDDKSKIKLYKKDSATDKLVAGAKLVITDSTGKVVRTINTTNNSITLDLNPGKYYITEESAPKGYERLTKKYEFVVKSDGTLQAVTNDPAFEISGMSIIIYNVKPTNVPDTGVAVNVFLTLGGLALIGFGGYLVYKNVKERKNIK